jgi:lambda repressor-like predicted transcriptional regulator
MGKALDITGMKFNRLTAMKNTWVFDRDGRYKWVFLCDCGSIYEASGSQVKNGNVKSCGCLVKELSKCGDKSRVHGMSRTPTYKCWKGLRARCLNKKHPYYKNYGGRGITVCDRWSSFELFFEDMGLKPSEAHSLDRIDNSAGYSKENCRWATAIVQGNNKRNNNILTYNGESLSVAQWSKKTGLEEDTIRARLKRGWSHEKTLSTKVLDNWPKKRKANIHSDAA